MPINCKQYPNYTVDSYSIRCMLFDLPQNALEYFVNGTNLLLSFNGGRKMVDSLNQAARSAMMSRIRGKNTRPELIVRKLAFAAGYRYRLHVRALPGAPDMVFPSRKKVIFIHGCFWHLHDNCALARMPKSRVEFWSEKLHGNKMRDIRACASLADLGWEVLVVWECELNDLVKLGERLQVFLGPPGLRERNLHDLSREKAAAALLG